MRLSAGVQDLVAVCNATTGRRSLSAMMAIRLVIFGKPYQPQIATSS